MSRRRPSRHRLPTPEPPSPTINRPTRLPSDHWPNSHPGYSPEIHRLACSINYLGLRNKCSQLRHGTRCIISPKYYVGANNYVREVVFQDGVVWIVLFAQLDVKGEFAAQARLMKMLRGRIPVPEVYGFSDNRIELGARYLVMEGICGIRAEAEYLMFGIPDRHWNHVLEQLGVIMAQGMVVSWKSFRVNTHDYQKDTDFWTEPAESNIQRALKEINEHKKYFVSGRYSTFIDHVYFHLKSLFAELLYLGNDLLHPKSRPSDVSQRFPVHIPPLTMQNIIFDEEYNIRSIIGFSQSESVSTWDYFQYPLGLEDPFEEHPMTHTITWMRELFLEAWRGELSTLKLSAWERMPTREKWCRKDKVAILYEFRKTPEHTSKILNELLCCFHPVDKSTTAEILFEAYTFVLCSLLAHDSNAWNGKLEMYIDVLLRLVRSSVQTIHELAEQGRYISLRLLDQKAFPPLPPQG
jgi:hypothetical protein